MTDLNQNTHQNTQQILTLNPVGHNYITSEELYLLWLVFNGKEVS